MSSDPSGAHLRDPKASFLSEKTCNGCPPEMSCTINTFRAAFWHHIRNELAVRGDRRQIQAKVGDFYPAFGIDEDVVWFDVPVHDAGLVGFAEAFADLAGIIYDFIHP